MIGSSMGVGELGLNLFNETRETVALRRACARDPQLRERLLGPTSASMPVPTFMVYSPLRTSVEILYADDNGNGDLVVTLLDPAVPLPLLRYKTGDRARFVSPAQLKQLADAIAPGYLPPAARKLPASSAARTGSAAPRTDCAGRFRPRVAPR